MICCSVMKSIVSVSIQCLETVYGLTTSDQNQVAQYRIQRNLLDIFNSQLSEVNNHFCSPLSAFQLCGHCAWYTTLDHLNSILSLSGQKCKYYNLLVFLVIILKWSMMYCTESEAISGSFDLNHLLFLQICFESSSVLTELF